MLNIGGLSGCIVLPSSPCYDEARQDYNSRFNKYPKVIVYCNHTKDVVNAVLWARRERVPFRLRCGGHSYEAYSLISCGLIIDVSGLQALMYHKENQTIQIGAGHRLLPLYEALWNEGVTLPGGTCSTVGISGQTLGGGYGYLSRLFGMTCDNLLEVEMVTAEGTIICVNENHHSDLLWACRGGGGGSFGAVTSFRFRVHPIKTVVRFRMTWEFSSLRDVVHFWQAWAPYTDPRLTSLLALPSQNQGDLRASGVFVGPEQELRQMIAPLREMLPPKSVELHALSWLETARQLAGSPLRQEKFKGSSAYAYQPLSSAAIDQLILNLQHAPGQANVVSLAAYGGAISQVPVRSTAFVHRQPLFLIHYQSYWVKESDADKNINWIEDFRSSMLPYTWGAYQNYADSLILDWPDAYFGENLNRLMEIKRKYDPDNLFCFEQSIPLG
ncbi:FAD-binding oxidoreductase [Anoxybacterium hadale]|uniref:FAD-binding oxidoreductase n=1 Tax=Anoxybacterium hadale TaxID=3408580 RepID=A0ACD1A9X7_9FIRM|nr:FAD-binding oxidoreductase [Clostridiales bacterium]